MEKINIVVCSDDVEYKVAIKNKIVRDECAIIGYADIDKSAGVRIRGFVPDVVAFLLDSRDIDESFMNFVEELKLSSIGATPIILTDKVTVEIVNMAAQAGVRQVMDISVGGENLCDNIIKLVEKERKYNTSAIVERKTRSKVYAFFSGKGGVGKTTLCTSTGVSLAMQGKKTLLVDLDLQFGDADMALDLSPSESIADLSRDSSGVSIDNLTSCCINHSSGLSLLPSPVSPELAEYVTSASVKSILDVARNYYEYILIDCGCAITDPVITALESSDEIFIVYDINILSLKRAKTSMNVLQQLNQSDKAKLVINKNAKKNNVKISDFENLLGIPAYAVISEDFKNINASLNNGNPVTIYKPRCVVSKDLSAFADKIIMEREGEVAVQNNKKNKKSKRKIK